MASKLSLFILSFIELTLLSLPNVGLNQFAEFVENPKQMLATLIGIYGMVSGGGVLLGGIFIKKFRIFRVILPRKIRVMTQIETPLLSKFQPKIRM